MFKFPSLKYLIFLLLICACQPKELTVNVKDKNIKLDKEILLFKERPFTGLLQSKNDTLTAYQAYYFNGKKNGVEKKYFNDGILAEECFYIKGKKSGIHKAWWNEKQLKFVYQFDSLGNYNGKQLEWHSNGHILKEYNFVNGKEAGSQKMWSKDGNIRANYIVKNGERFGLIESKKCKTDIDEFK